MGIETTKALQARRRESAAQIERLIARADERNPIGSARRARIKETARLARRKVRALTAAQQSVAAIELEIGQALLRLRRPRDVTQRGVRAGRAQPPPWPALPRPRDEFPAPTADRLLHRSARRRRDRPCRNRP